jgi:hypothetical protein
MNHEIVAGIVNALPIEKMVSAPLMAAIKAQSEMSMAMAQFVNSVGLDSEGQVRMVTFTYDDATVVPPAGQSSTEVVPTDNAGFITFAQGKGWATTDEGLTFTKGQETKNKADLVTALSATTVSSTKRHIQAPFIALTGIPNIAIEDVNIAFELEVNTAEDSKTSTTSNATNETTASWDSWWSPVKANTKFTASVTHNSEQTRHTDTRAKYTFNVSARKQPAPEAFMRIVDAITNGVALPTTKEPTDNLLSKPLGATGLPTEES